MIKIKKIVNYLGNLYLSIVLFFLIVIDLVYGYICLNGRETLFSPINEIGLIKWYSTYGITYFRYTIWLLFLLLLLLLLGINTIICTTDRCITIVKNRNIRHKLIKISPHIIHYAVILILFGFLISYVFSYTKRVILLPNKKEQISQNMSIKIESLKIDFYTGNRLSFLKNRAINCMAKLCILKDNNKEKCSYISLNSPVIYGMYSFHILRFSPSFKESMSLKPYLLVVIKRDPGIWIYLIGSVLLIGGLFIYLYGKIRSLFP